MGWGSPQEKSRISGMNPGLAAPRARLDLMTGPVGRSAR